jgi:carboxymethylenebutenolidase
MRAIPCSPPIFTIEAAYALSQELNQEQAKKDISDAVEFLSGLDAVTRPEMGVIGFSLGAYYALGLSVDDPQRMRAVVLFYGTGEGDFARSRAAYMGHFAKIDEYEPEPFVRSVEQALRAADRPVTFYTYENTGHWFFEPDRPDAYNPAAAQLAWERTLAFLKDSL